MKIHIFYRHTEINNQNPSRPDWFSYIKCFNNLKKSIEHNGNVNLTLVYDGDNSELDPLVNKSLSSYPLYKTSYKSSLLSYRDLLLYIKNLKNINQNDLIYFLENDYLHTPNWVEIILNLYHTYDVSEYYISLYDHNDKYTHPMYKSLVSKILTTEDCHWRTTPSTCGSFIITKKLFDLDYDVWSTHIGDHNTFLYLNKSRNRQVLTPIPGLSTHCMKGLLSPTIDWKKINN